MKSIRVVLISIAALLTLNGVLARTPFKTKKEDRYKTIENDISDDVPTLPIAGGYIEPEPLPRELSNDELKSIYTMAGLYGRVSGSNGESPYYYYAFNPSVVYDPKSPFYIGNDYELTNPYPPAYVPDSYSEPADDAPDGTIIYESDGMSGTAELHANFKVYGTSEEPILADDMVTSADEQAYEEPEPEPEREESQPEPYWMNPESNPSTQGYFNNFMMGIPAQLQSFAMFNPEYNPAEYEQYERLAAENERREEDLEVQGLDANTVENPANFPRGGRAKRGFAKMLNLRDMNMDGSAHLTGKGINGKLVSEKVVLNADCRGGFGNNGGGRSNPNGGASDAANGVADAAGTVQNAAGQVSGAAGDAVNAASEAAENLRLANSRRTNRRGGNNNRNNNNSNRRGAE